MGILSYFVVLVVIGVPIWWYTTRVYRAYLPLSEIEALKLENFSEEKVHEVPLSLEYDILISFVHPDPGNLDIELKGKYLAKQLEPILDSLSPIAAFVVKTQWLFLTDLGINAIIFSDYHALEEAQLSQVITPLETKLWSNISPRPVINLVIYFPPCASPLYILDKEKHVLKTNAFLSPGWGGIFILNPTKESCTLKKFVPNIQLMTSVFATQINQLFKVGNMSNAEDINILKFKKTEELLHSTYRTLSSLDQLLSEISSIVISDDVGEKISDAVKNAKWAKSNLKRGNLNKALEKAKIAFFKAEAAFSDPSLLALLYFPEDQK